MDSKNVSQELIDFIKNSPSCFHAVKTISTMLDSAGFTELNECDSWKIHRSGAYYVIRNNSSIIAFRIPALPDPAQPDRLHFQIAAAHSDSPTFKVKQLPEIRGQGGMLSLNTEGYGGMIDASWFDRPLSLAGRVLVQEGSSIVSRLVSFSRPMLIIPNVAIHFNRDINKGYDYSHQTDLIPLMSAGELQPGALDEALAQQLCVQKENILSRDLFLVNMTQPCIWGLRDEFVSSPKLDDLQCAFSITKAFCSSDKTPSVNVMAIFDNEEVGSITKQGAAGTFLADTLKRMILALGYTEQDYYRACEAGFLVSCDNAHAVHPNHPEKTDCANRAFMNKGIVIKENASQKYTSDAVSKAVFNSVCAQAGVPVQYFANNSDMAGGSTLGNLSNQQAGMNAVDIGVAQLAMHSSYETCGSLDTSYMVQALAAFYTTDVYIHDRNTIELKKI